MNKLEIKKASKEFRQSLGLDDEIFHEDTLLKLLEEKKYYIFYENFGRESISGAAYRKNNLNFILLNNSQSLGRQNFTLSHELGHLVIHNKDVFDLDEEDKALEREANIFASHFLLPEDQVKFKLGAIKNITKFDILMISQYFRVSFSAAAIRLSNIYGKRKMPENYDEINVYKIINNYEEEGDQLAKNLELDDSLYRPTHKTVYPKKKIMTKVVRLYQDGKISFGKFNEIIDILGMDPENILKAIKGKQK